MTRVLMCLFVTMLAHGASGDWQSEVELGAVFTGGNTEQETMKFRFDTARDGESILQNVHVEALKASEDGNTSAEKYALAYRIEWKLGDDRGLFARSAYEDDRFSGFDRQVDLTVGYQRKLLDRETMQLSADAGLGVRNNKLETGESDTEALLQFAARYSWQVSGNALFKQFVGFDIGEEITTSRAESSLESTIAGDLAMKLALKFKHNSEVPLGKDKTDSEATVTLVYKF